MYKKLTVQNTIRVPPRLLGRDIGESVLESLKEQYEGRIRKNMGVVLKVTDIDEIGDGDIQAEDAGVYYPITFTALVFEPEMHEVVEGEVIDLTEFGAFIRIGPIDGLCHISQIMDNYVNYNEEQDQLVGEEGNRILMKGDTVRARITAVSLNDTSDNKVNLTMRQPALGKLEWIQESMEEDEEEDEE